MLAPQELRLPRNNLTIERPFTRPSPWQLELPQARSQEYVGLLLGKLGPSNHR